MPPVNAVFNQQVAALMAFIQSSGPLAAPYDLLAILTELGLTWGVAEDNKTANAVIRHLEQRHILEFVRDGAATGWVSR